MNTTDFSRILAVGSLFLCLNTFFAQSFTWLKGSTTSSVASTYGTQGVAATANNPGGRHGCATWTDAQGNMWLFGGEGYASSATLSWLNDLWKYNPATNQWTWMKGSNGPNAAGVYGTQGVAAAGNNPGAREFMMSWTDASGNFWLFGGDGYDGSGTFGNLCDLWKYNPATNQWTWMKGANAANVNGIYGTQNIAAPGNFPGSRYGSATWVDNAGKLWLYGGNGYAASTQGFLGDLWKYDPVTNNWTWMKGSNVSFTPGTYGSMSIPAATNVPGGRRFPGFWTDASGNNLIMFGGLGLPGSAGAGYLNDMWSYNITTGNWTWLSGPNTVNQTGTYGSIGVASPANNPGARHSAASWRDAFGNYWMFGGYGFDITMVNHLNDLWKYNPVNNQWTWMKGSNTINQSGTYGIQGVAAPANIPGARHYNSWWKDTPGMNFWLFGGLGFDMTNNPADNMNDLWGIKIPCTPDSIMAAPKVFCMGTTTSLTAINSIPSAVSWYTTPSAGSSIGSGSVLALPSLSAVTNPSVYTYYAEATSCTVAPRAMVTVTVFPLPQLSVTGPSSVCPGVMATFTMTGAASYTWNNASTSNTISIAPNAPVICMGENSYGCQSSYSLTLGQFALPNVIVNSLDHTICRGETQTLTATGATSYSWNGAAGNSTLAVSPTVSTTYTLTGIDQNGCVNTYSYTQFIATCIGINEEKSNVETSLVYPNPGNGTFSLSLPDEAELAITNQLGQIVLETKLRAGISLVETSLGKGIYLYTLTFKDKSSGTGKLIIQ